MSLSEIHTIPVTTLVPAETAGPEAVTSSHADIVPPPPAAEGGRIRRIASRAIAAVAIPGAFALGFAASDASPAEAAPSTDVTVVEAAPSGEDSGLSAGTIIGAILAGLSSGIAGTGLVLNYREKKRAEERAKQEQARIEEQQRYEREQREEEAFVKVLGDIKDGTGQDREVAFPIGLMGYVTDPDRAPRVFAAATDFLKARRAAVWEAREKLNDDQVPKEMDRALTRRRSQDRDALNTLLAAWPLVREQNQLEAAALAQEGGDPVKNSLRALAAQVGLELDPSEPAAPVPAIVLDYIRGIENRSFADMDLTGVGLRGNQFTLVDFSRARLREAQLKYAAVRGCNLSKTDLRAAYLSGATFNTCVIDENTQFGNLPPNHYKATWTGGLGHQGQPNELRGDTQVILRDLVWHDSSDPDGPAKVRAMVHKWQTDHGLVLLQGSNPEYFLDNATDADRSRTFIDRSTSASTAPPAQGRPAQRKGRR